MVSLEDNLVMMSQGDIETIRTLFQQRPELWDDFKILMELTDCLNEQARDCNKLWDLLKKISNGVCAKTENVLDFSRFAAVLRFAEKSVGFMRQTMLRKGLPFITEFTFPLPDVETACLYILRSLFLNLSCSGREFATQLAKTGVLKDLVEDLKHIQDQSAEKLVSDIFTEKLVSCSESFALIISICFHLAAAFRDCAMCMLLRKVLRGEK